MNSRVAAIAVALATIAGLPTFGTYASSEKSIRVLPSSGPRTLVAAKKNCPKKHDKSQLTLHVHITGIKKLVTVPRKKAIAGEGVVEAFNDSIPKVAYKKYSSRTPAPNFLGAVASTRILLCASLPFFHTRGKHKVIVALGKTTGVLYRGVKPSSMTITLK